MPGLFPASISACIPSPEIFREEGTAEDSVAPNAHEEQRPQLAQPSSKASSSEFPMFFLPPHYEHTSSRNTDATMLPQGQAPSMQSLITAGSRLYGSSNCLDPRTCLGIKIYDFAVYADVEQLRRATSTHQQQLMQQLQQHQQQSPNHPPSLLSQDSSGTENGEASVQGEATHHFLAPRNLLGASKGLLQGIGSACSWFGSGILLTVDWGTDSGVDEPFFPSPGDEDNGQAAGTTRRERRQQRRQEKQQQRQLKRGLNWERKMAKRQEKKEGRERKAAQQHVLSSGVISVGGAAVEVLMRDPSLPVSVVLRATRDLPVHLLQQEMGRVLHKRFLKAGGSEGSPELPKLLECFSSQRLPAQCCGSSSSSSSSKRADKQDDHPASTPFRASPPSLLSFPFAHPSQPSTPPSPPTTKKVTKVTPAQDVTVKQGSMLVFSRDQCGRLSATALTSGCCSTTPTHDAYSNTDSSNSTSSSLFGSSNPLFGNSSSSSSSGLQGGGGSAVNAQCVSAAQSPCAQPVRMGSGWGGEGGVGLLEQPLQCAPLCEALLDMYLGSQPACNKAKVSAERSLSHLLASWAQPEQQHQQHQQQQQQLQASKGCSSTSMPVYQPSRTSGHVIQCQDSSDTGTCVVCVQ